MVFRQTQANLICVAKWSSYLESSAGHLHWPCYVWLLDPHAHQPLGFVSLTLDLVAVLLLGHNVYAHGHSGGLSGDPSPYSPNGSRFVLGILWENGHLQSTIQQTYRYRVYIICVPPSTVLWVNLPLIRHLCPLRTFGSSLTQFFVDTNIRGCAHSPVPSFLLQCPSLTHPKSLEKAGSLVAVISSDSVFLQFLSEETPKCITISYCHIIIMGSSEPVLPCLLFNIKIIHLLSLSLGFLEPLKLQKTSHYTPYSRFSSMWNIGVLCPT